MTFSSSLAENDFSGCSRIAKEIAMVKGFLSKEGTGRCFILASDIRIRKIRKSEKQT